MNGEWELDENGEPICTFGEMMKAIKSNTKVKKKEEPEHIFLIDKKDVITVGELIDILTTNSIDQDTAILIADSEYDPEGATQVELKDGRIIIC